MILIPLLDSKDMRCEKSMKSKTAYEQKKTDNKTKKDLVRSYIDEKKFDKKYEQRIRFHLKK